MASPLLQSLLKPVVPVASVRRNLFASAADGAAFGGMVGLGETYLAAFALAIGLNETSAGLVASLPMVIGGIMQLVSLKAVEWIGSEKRWIVVNACLQALAFLPMIIAAIMGSISLPVLLLIASVYWGAGLATGPVWNTWIETIVPAGVRARYFASRSRLAQWTTLLGFLAGGAVLAGANASGHALLGFAVIFLAACLMRLVSTYWLLQHHPVTRRRTPDPPSSTASLSSVVAAPSIHGGRLLVYMVALQAAVQIVSPYFTPFMLSELKFSYLEFVGLMAVSFVAKAMSFAYWANLSKRASAKTLLWVGAIGLIPLSSLWIVSHNYVWLVIAQIISGVFWAAYELGFFLTFFEVLPRARRIRMLTVYNFANTLAIGVGATLGAIILRHWGADHSTYLWLFGISSVGRLAALAILASASLASVPILRIGIRVIGVRPGGATVDVPVISSL